MRLDRVPLIRVQDSGRQQGSPRFSGQYLIQPRATIAPEDLYAGKALKLTYAPEVKKFLSMSPQERIRLYRQRHPQARPEFLKQAIHYQPRYFRYGGADLFRAYNRHTQQSEMVLIEINSTPGGLSNTPALRNPVYQKFAHFFSQTLKASPFCDKKQGVLAVVSHGQRMDPLGIAQAIAQRLKEPVHLITHDKEKLPHQQPWRVDASTGGLFVQSKEGVWHKARGAVALLGPSSAFATQPLTLETGVLIDPPLVHRAGGVEKTRANEAFRAFNMHALNKKDAPADALIRIPKTWQTAFSDIPRVIQSLGGSAVVKLSDGNGGDGIWMIRTSDDLAKFQKAHQEAVEANPSLQHTRQYVVQELLLPIAWANLTQTPAHRYNRSTLPDRNTLQRHVYDTRMLVAPLDGKWEPLGVFGRKAPGAIPTPDKIQPTTPLEKLWDILGTNLSRKSSTGWFFREEGLMVFDKPTYDSTGLSLEDLVDGYFQSIFAMQAIDKQIDWYKTLERKLPPQTPT